MDSSTEGEKLVFTTKLHGTKNVANIIVYGCTCLHNLHKNWTNQPVYLGDEQVAIDVQCDAPRSAHRGVECRAVIAMVAYLLAGPRIGVNDAVRSHLYAKLPNKH